MIKCPSCQHDNEAGTEWCEQCGMDLPGVAGMEPAKSPQGGVGDSTPATPAATATHTGEPIPLTDAGPSPESEDFIRLLEQAAPGNRSLARPQPPPAVPRPAAAGAGPPRAAGVELARPVPPPPVANPKLVVLRGLKINQEYPIWPGPNYIGRTDEKPVDIDLEDQETEDRIWVSREHACLHFEDGRLTIEDLKSTNGTFVNRRRIPPGTRVPLQPGDSLQIGTVHLKVMG